jgi:hypothetical protein
MTTGKPTELQQLIEQGKVLRVLSRATRTRALKRAQLSILNGASLVPPQAAAHSTSVSSVAWLGGAAAVIGLVGAALALRGGPTRVAEGPALGESTPACAPVAPAHSVSVAESIPSSAPPVSSAAEVARQQRRAPVADFYAAELELLQGAHAAFQTRDFGSALRLLTEHARRFPNGRLAEEREALRVRALSGSGRIESARVAASAFALSFPRSVFLARTMAPLDAGSAKPSQ